MFEKIVIYAEQSGKAVEKNFPMSESHLNRKLSMSSETTLM